MTRSKFSDAERSRAVRMLETRGSKATQAAFGVHETTLYGWRRRVMAETQRASQMRGGRPTGMVAANGPGPVVRCPCCPARLPLTTPIAFDAPRTALLAHVKASPHCREVLVRHIPARLP